VSENLILLEALEESGTQIAGLKTLCLRAADALEKIHKEWPIEELGLDASIIAELRKAAQ